MIGCQRKNVSKLASKKSLTQFGYFVRRKWCKVTAHFLNHQIFSNFFEKKIKSHSLATEKRCVIFVLRLQRYDCFLNYQNNWTLFSKKIDFFAFLGRFAAFYTFIYINRHQKSDIWRLSVFFLGCTGSGSSSSTIFGLLEGGVGSNQSISSMPSKADWV